MRKLTCFVCIVLLFAAFSSAFAAKAQWWPGERPTPRAAGTLAGEITAITDTTLTVQTENNGAPIFTVNKDTRVTGKKTSLGALVVGDRVKVEYSTLPDDNVWARVINVPRETTPPVNNVASIFGNVAEVGQDTITIMTERNGAQTYAVTDKTQVRILGERGTIGQVKVGDPAIIVYEVNSATHAARRIRVLARGVWPRLSGNVSGRVLAIDSSGITVQTEKNGNQTFAIVDKTRVFIYDQNAALDQIKVGDNVAIAYRVLDNGSRIANTIRIRVPTLTGKIASISNGGFVIATRTQTGAISLTAETKIFTRLYVGTPADLKVGYRVTVRGIPTGNVIRALSVSFSVPEIKGTVVSASGNLIVVKTLKGKVVNVYGSDATVILVRPRTAPNYTGTPADVKVGSAVNIGGHNAGPNTMNALWIDVLVP